MEQDINEVKNFWEANPLWVGESKFKPGTFEFFEEHRQTVIDDCFAGKLDSRIFPKIEKNQKILDLGCGIGFWTVELLLKGYTNVMAADLTRNALTLTEKRLSAYGVIAELSIQNAENMTFKNSEFSHVNCLGVIHHSPNPESCIKEIARVLGAKGTACISVYYKNFFLRIWPLLKYPARIIMRILGGGLKGRGRENIFFIDDVNEIVRLYDGDKNPIGRAYSKREFFDMLRPYFEIKDHFYHFFPARALPFKLPRFVHSLLDRFCGFMIFVVIQKRDRILSHDPST